MSIQSGGVSRFAIASNACSADDHRIEHTVPSWLRAWGDRLTEILIVVDRQPPTGRIADLHGEAGQSERLDEVLAGLQASDSRVRVMDLPAPEKLDQMLTRWFGQDRPIRCQAGTPIAAFAYAIDEANSDCILRCDCDMVFHDRGFVDQAFERLDQGIDLVGPPRLGRGVAVEHAVSTRAIFLDRGKLRQALPIKAHQLDWARRLHRRLHGRPFYLAFEQMLECEVQAGRLRHDVLDGDLGYSLHIPRRLDFLLSGIERIIARAEAGDIPRSQVVAGWNFNIETWDEAAV